MSECKTTIGSLSTWLQNELDGVDTPRHRQLAQHIDGCPACIKCVAALKRVDEMSAGLVSAEIAEQEEDTGWLDRLLTNLALEARAGRSVPLGAEFEVDTLTVTEGAILAAIRSIADSMENLIIGRCRLEGDIESPGSPITVQVSAAVRFDAVENDAVERLRELIIGEIHRVTELNVEVINIEIQDVYGKPQKEDKV